MTKRIIGLAVGLATTMALFGVGTAQAGTPKFTLNVVHGIPGVEVDVCVNGAKAITGFEPGDVVSGVRLPQGEYRLKVTPAGEACSAAILNAKADLQGGRNRNYTVVANLDDHGSPNLALFRNNTRKTESGEARVIVRHTADAPAVNVWADGSPLNRGRRFVWGEQRRWDVPEGDYSVFVSLARKSAPVIGPADLSLMAGTSYQVYAWGNGAAGYGLIVIPLEVGEKH
ncbi:MAG: DUF4397 domain-containing protein [Actinomycetota bacterium]|nr:DUF4397 domain-containing protein [Actinomycetota bacterium]MDH5224791.1 DUF4397 domain-containing protein [Actinomycetota bacterium]MDH5314323.1 DUF4397 domain-containing protein [Actinomycetota bacterium]